MKKVLLTFLAVLPLVLSAQVCEPDPFYQDSTGVFPLPKSDTNPDGGIGVDAVIGFPYEFNFTVGVGDSITVNLLGQEVQLPLDSVVVNDVEGLPDGLTYVCEPGTCSFPKNSIGCAVIKGTPLSSVTPGDYPLVITGTAYFPVFPSTFVITFPGDFFPGDYTLTVLSELNSTNELEKNISVEVSPNPTAGPLQINIQSDIFGDVNLKVTDLLGKVHHQEKANLTTGENRINFDGGHLNNGLYILVLENELGRVSQKVLIQH